MMRNLIKLVIVLVLMLGVAGTSHGGLFSAGRETNEKSDGHLRITAGSINEIQGMVEETTRKVYEVEGRWEDAASGSTFTQDDFNMKGPYATLGVSLETQWKYFSLQMDVLGFKTEVNTVASRNYYIGIGDDVQYGGGEYSNMKIPEGTPFSMDILGGIMEIRGLITPFTFKPSPTLRITPWIDAGLMFFVGQYNIDAGDPTGTTTYMNPPEEYVIGGESSGFLGLGLPQIGFGGEIRMGPENGVNLVLQGDYAVCNYEGSSSFLTSSSEHEKSVDIDHTNTRIRFMVEFPMSSGRLFMVGAQYQLIESEGSITTMDDTPEEILADREKFDKYAEFRLSSLVGMIGLSF
ncbi:MAG: hypothetical protein A2283_09085 [Lentisphaerae bacterium RIFOXYA12_FULL_48_11]|nr:MAG: hypothetical protein A2283_09085 [Lentisphaerae bacterium RIFOXYA12_FULL_48_11]